MRGARQGRLVWGGKSVGGECLWSSALARRVQLIDARCEEKEGGLRVKEIWCYHILAQYHTCRAVVCTCCSLAFSPPSPVVEQQRFCLVVLAPILCSLIQRSKSFGSSFAVCWLFRNLSNKNLSSYEGS